MKRVKNIGNQSLLGRCGLKLLMISFSGIAAIWDLSLYANIAPIRIPFHDANPPPFAMIENGKLKGGLIKDVGDAVAGVLKVPIEYVYLSRKRLDRAMARGTINARSFTNPNWVDRPLEFEWTVPYFRQEDLFLSMKTFPRMIRQQNDLKGLRIGTILGNRYPTIARDFKDFERQRTDVASSKQNLKRLQAGRIDIAYGSSLEFRFILDKEIENYTLHDSMSEVTMISWALAKDFPFSLETMNSVLTKLIDSGQMETFVKKYNP